MSVQSTALSKHERKASTRKRQPKPAPDDLRLTYTVEEVGRLLGLSRGSAYLAAQSGAIPVVRVGRRLLVPRLALEQMLSKAGRAVSAT